MPLSRDAQRRRPGRRERPPATPAVPTAPPAGVRAPAAWPLLDAAGAGAGDRAAVDAGETWAGLMARAAGHLARGVVAVLHGASGRRVAVLAGKGNNGGDGWGAALRLRAAGASVVVVAPDGLEAEASAEATALRDAYRRAGGRAHGGTGRLAEVLAWAEVAVDALLGTGVAGAPRGPAGEAAAALLAERARSGLAVVACDVPSGVSADDGSAPDGSVVADLTVTLGAMKRGLLLHPGAASAGTVVIGDLGRRYAPPPSDWTALTPAGAAPDALAVDADKRDRGTVLAVAGAAGTAGAAALCGRGALAAGAGLVSVAVPEPVRAEVAAQDPAMMVRGLPADEQGGVDGTAAGAGPLADLTAHGAVVAGPGMGYGAGARQVVGDLRARAGRLVLDADALNVHREAPEALADHAGTLVLTPHQRELARIGGGWDGVEAWAHRVERVPRLAAEYRAIIVAKGPGTMVAAPDGRVWVCPLGGPELGAGGTGDLLAGMIAAAIAPVADEHDVPEAVARAVWWHAAAGRRAAERRGGRASVADVLAEVGPTLTALRRAAGDPAALGRGADDTAPGGGVDGATSVDGQATEEPTGGRRGLVVPDWEAWRAPATGVRR